MTTILVVKPIKNEQTMGGGYQVIEELQGYNSATKAMTSTIQKRQ